MSQATSTTIPLRGRTTREHRILERGLKTARGEPIVKTPSRTYLLRCTVTGLVKIGIAVDVEQRRRTIQSMCPTRLEVVIDAPGGRELERDLHERYAHKRQHGEWFALTHDELQEIVWHLPEDEPEQEKASSTEASDLTEAERRFLAVLDDVMDPDRIK